ncbi:PEP-CTERM sorting domain-containing protein [Caldimonas brevitalea]|uniref:Ice-binding protein C-terminal domain-containing protein n=1 Tax=Caldimonas brevitalea TaxID=413882 RepID=A0A0G3BW78_9BURK|nr:PEP-CTERM sorting domain-containing protein [Caldimonas brevitalea]AKJ31646.1 hypothetical protein AAW51_4955 [Caldimonas brevitalea]
MKPLHIAIALLCGACIQSAAAGPLPRYQVEALAAPDLNEYHVTGFNDHGQVVGYSVNEGDPEDWWDDRYVSYLWSAGRVQRLTGPENGLGAKATGINDNGVILGQRLNEEDRPFWKPVVWQPGAEATPLPGRIDGALTHDINNNGVVVGEHYFQGSHSEGLVWRNGQLTQLQNLPNPNQQDPWYGGALGLNDRGLIVGYGSITVQEVPAVNADITRAQAVMWEENGNLKVLDSQIEGWEFAYARDINEAGRIIGTAERFESGGPWHDGQQAALWVDGELTLLGDLGSQALDITEDGIVVGTNKGDGVIWLSDGTMLSVDSLLDGTDAASWDILSVQAANDVGQYLVSGRVDGQLRYAILTPVPEPESVALVLAGLGLLGVRLRQRRRAV